MLGFIPKGLKEFPLPSMVYPLWVFSTGFLFRPLFSPITLAPSPIHALLPAFGFPFTPLSCLIVKNVPLQNAARSLLFENVRKQYS